MGLKSGIEHIDTNILVRLITRDDGALLKKAKRLLSQKDKVFVFEDAAMMEVVFVLAGPVYEYPREKIAAKINAVLSLDNIYCNKAVIRDALSLYVSHPKLSFVDCYLAILAETSREIPLWTFDRKLISQCRIAREP